VQCLFQLLEFALETFDLLGHIEAGVDVGKTVRHHAGQLFLRLVNAFDNPLFRRGCCIRHIQHTRVAGDTRPNLVNYVQGAGHWLDAERDHRTRAAEISADRKYFNQDRAVIQYVMENPTDRVTYGDLRMIKEEFDDLMQLSLQAKTLTRPIAFERYIDDRFVKAAKPARIAL